ncbi:hypothetical protein QBC36DRAFT_86725 [Triangularia setosa]|uniref:Transmembrane protein n=1 Tax=Triangularia setosa TaxID=2587417 RepID=A0AAN6VXY9_9PEZI|nr:hypothetical protein QBC36DRAFT_86725 [Podospora setosa]
MTTTTTQLVSLTILCKRHDDTPIHMHATYTHACDIYTRMRHIPTHATYTHAIMFHSFQDSFFCLSCIYKHVLDLLRQQRSHSSRFILCLFSFVWFLVMKHGSSIDASIIVGCVDYTPLNYLFTLFCCGTMRRVFVVVVVVVVVCCVIN